MRHIRCYSIWPQKFRWWFSFFLTFWGYCVFHNKNGLVTCVAWRLQEIVYYISWVSLTVDGREFKRQQLLLRYANLVRTGCDGSKRGLTINWRTDGFVTSGGSGEYFWEVLTYMFQLRVIYLDYCFIFWKKYPIRSVNRLCFKYEIPL